MNTIYSANTIFDILSAHETLLSFCMCAFVIITALYFRSKQTHNIYSHNLFEPSVEEIMALIPANVYWLDRNGTFLGCNNRMLSMLKLQSVDLYRGKTYEDFYEINHIPNIKEIDEEIMATNTAKTIEEVSHNNQTYLTNKIPLHNKYGQVIGLLGVSIDITEMKQLEKTLKNKMKCAEVAMIEKTEFLYNMRHDIKTPLGNMIGLTKLLFDNTANSIHKDIIKDISTSAESLMALLNEMLEFAAIDEGIHPIQQEQFSLRNIFRNIHSMMSSAITFSGVEFKMLCSEKVPTTLLGDAMRIHRILLNLASNAMTFTKAGQVTIYADIIEETDTQYHLQIKIKDTGIGIPKDKMNFIFQRFNKLQPSIISNPSGAGLGLYIVKQFVNDMNGTIHVTSEAGKGSEFTCIIPFSKI